MVKNNQNNDFNDNKLTNIDSITVIRNPDSDNDVSNKKYVDNRLDKNSIIRFNQALENYLKVSVGNDTSNLTKYDKIQKTDVTENKQGNGQYLLPRWKVDCNDKNSNGVTTNFIRATKSNSPTSQPGATSLAPICNSFMSIETSSHNHGPERVFVNERVGKEVISFRLVI